MPQIKLIKDLDAKKRAVAGGDLVAGVQEEPAGVFNTVKLSMDEMQAYIDTVGGGGGGSTRLVYDPTGTQQDNVYTDITDFLTALDTLEGAVAVFKHSGSVAIPAGAYTWENISRFEGQGGTITMPDGVTFDRLPLVVSTLNLEIQCLAAGNGSKVTGGQTLFLENAATVKATGDDPVFDTTTGVLVISIGIKCSILEGSVSFAQCSGGFNIYWVTRLGEIEQNTLLQSSGTSIVEYSADTSHAVSLTQSGAITFTERGAVGIVQRIHTIDSAVVTTSATIPPDDTIPQNTEGIALGNLDTTITPLDSNNKIEVDYRVYCSDSITAGMVAALFKDSDVSAVDVATATGAAGYYVNLNSRYEEPAGSTVARTYKIRVGPDGGTLTVNGLSGARRWGGVLYSTMTVTERKP